MRTLVSILVGLLTAAPALAAPAYPLDDLLIRAKVVFIGEVARFDGTNVTLKVQDKLRADPATDALTLTVDAVWGKPATNGRYFVFSQGNDQWGDPKNEAKLGQGLDGQGSYCGWLMLLIQNVKGDTVVKSAYSFKFRTPGEGIGPLTLDQAKQLVRETTFKETDKRTPSHPSDSTR